LKYVVLVLELMIILPLASALRQNPRYVPLIWQFVGAACFLSSVVPQLGISVIDWAYYPGHTWGVEITIIDALMVALFIFQRGQSNAARIPFRLPMALYFCAVTFSAFFAGVPMAALFYSWQLLRMYLVFIVVARACSDERVVPSLLRGLAIGLLAEACTVLYQKYGLGILQPPGTFPHQNSLGLVSNLVAIPFVALLLAERRSWLFSSTPVAGFMIAALTASRATMGMAGLGLMLTFVQSIVRKSTSRKIKLGVMGLFLAAVIIPIGISSFQKRIEVQAGYGSAYSDYDERAAYINAASLMLMDHPFGVGANNFVIVANTGGYYDRAGVAAGENNRSAHVHNIYWLSLAEAGYLGLISLLLVLAQPLYVSLKSSWRFRDRPEADLLGGLGVALLITYIHSYFEWILITGLPQYFLAITFGLVAGVSIKLANDPRHQVGSVG
jgi:hypothetical protein